MGLTIVHLSDIHYGPPFQEALEPILLRQVQAESPNLVVVSGDLTQRAKSAQFLQARAFLERLPNPYLVIPGNHDVPLYNVFDRLFRSLERYKRHIRPQVDMTVQVDGITAVGLNSAFGWTNDAGRITASQLASAEEAFAAAPKPTFKLVVTHHHFVNPPGVHQRGLPERLLERFAAWGVELVLTGHTHLSHIERHPAGPVLAQAATATANRWKKLAKRVNSFHVITVGPDAIQVQVREFDPARQIYAPVECFAFDRRATQFGRNEP